MFCGHGQRIFSHLMLSCPASILFYQFVLFDSILFLSYPMSSIVSSTDPDANRVFQGGFLQVRTVQHLPSKSVYYVLGGVIKIPPRLQAGCITRDVFNTFHACVPRHRHVPTWFDPIARAE